MISPPPLLSAPQRGAGVTHSGGHNVCAQTLNGGLVCIATCDRPTIAMVVDSHCQSRQVPPFQVDTCRALSTPAVQAAESMMFTAAFVEHRYVGAQSEDHWHHSDDACAMLFRTIIGRNMGVHPRTQVTPRPKDGLVRGQCLGMSFSRDRQCTCTTYTTCDHELVREVARQIRLVDPGFRFSSLQLNSQLRAKPHRNTANHGRSYRLSWAISLEAIIGSCFQAAPLRRSTRASGLSPMARRFTG